jgi:hypothetical protein
MTTTTFITVEEYKMMGLDFKNVLSYVDTTELRKKFEKELTKKKVVGVCVWSYGDDEFKNIQNTDVLYVSPVCCRWSDDGCFETSYGMPATRHPLGDVIIVYK